MRRSVEHRLAVLESLVANLVRVGEIDQVDYTPPVPRARVQIGELLTDWLPLPAIRAGGDRATWLLEVGEQVVVLAPGGRLEQGVISHALNRTAAVPTSSSASVAKLQFSDGSIIQMDRTAGVLTLAPVDKVVIPADVEITGDVTHVGNYDLTGDLDQVGDVTLTGGHTQTGNVTLTGNVTQTGDTTLTGTLTADTDVASQTISLQDHEHPNGTLGDPTGPPTP